MKVIIRKETVADFVDVFKLIEKAFENEIYSDHSEQFLVERLRKSEAFVPNLSLVAVSDEKIVGHILLTKIQINGSHGSNESLALAPVSVLPSYQKRGIGGQLIIAAHDRARELGFSSIILLGHKDYYPRFGYRQAEQFGITLPFDVPPENCMAIELIPKGLLGVSGMVEYPSEFNL
jgi:predicted N-acetyltransferase YhbS